MHLINFYNDRLDNLHESRAGSFLQTSRGTGCNAEKKNHAGFNYAATNKLKNSSMQNNAYTHLQKNTQGILTPWVFKTISLKPIWLAYYGAKPPSVTVQPWLFTKVSRAVCAAALYLL
jgi:hypothetical protein